MSFRPERSLVGRNQHRTQDQKPARDGVHHRPDAVDREAKAAQEGEELHDPKSLRRVADLRDGSDDLIIDFAAARPATLDPAG